MLLCQREGQEAQVNHDPQSKRVKEGDGKAEVLLSLWQALFDKILLHEEEAYEEKNASEEVIHGGLGSFRPFIPRAPFFKGEADEAYRL